MFYDEPVRRSFDNLRKSVSMSRARAARAQGHSLTVGAKKRLRRALNNFSLLCPRKWKENPCTGRIQLHCATMLVLTIPCKRKLSGAEAAENLLTPFLDWMGRTAKTSHGKGIEHFVYKVEEQEKRDNKQLHYHIVTNEMVNVVEARKVWNNLMRKAGYLADYAREHYTYNVPNSVDVTAWEDSTALASYLIKEFSKSEQNPEGMDARVWGCSEGLETGYFTVLFTGQHRKRLDKLVKDKKVRVYAGERFAVATFQKGLCSFDLILNAREKELFEERVAHIKGKDTGIPRDYGAIAYLYMAEEYGNVPSVYTPPETNVLRPPPLKPSIQADLYQYFTIHSN
jgi:hypothetical protein